MPQRYKPKSSNWLQSFAQSQLMDFQLHPHTKFVDHIFSHMNPNLQTIQRASNSREEMVAFVPKEAGCVLEIGFGQGAFSKLLKERVKAPEIWGVEITKPSSSWPEDYLDHLLIGDFESKILPLPSGYFDCIVFNDVIEHFINPWDTLNYTKTLLKPTGKIVASIPNVRFFGNLHHLLFEKDWKYENWGIRDKTHLRFFTKKSIERLADDCDFILEKIQGINPHRFTRKYQILKKILPNFMEDTEYLQFAIVISLKH